jgi:hypothetical protein
MRARTRRSPLGRSGANSDALTRDHGGRGCIHRACIAWSVYPRSVRTTTRLRPREVTHNSPTLSTPLTPLRRSLSPPRSLAPPQRTRLLVFAGTNFKICAPASAWRSLSTAFTHSSRPAAPVHCFITHDFRINGSTNVSANTRRDALANDMNTSCIVAPEPNAVPRSTRKPPRSLQTGCCSARLAADLHCPIGSTWS